MSAEDRATGYAIPPRWWAWLGRPRAIAVLLWLAAAGVGAYLLWHAFVWFNTRPETPERERRADGNAGHVQIDFAGQWVMARMLVEGHGRELYHRHRQWEVVRASFPDADESPFAREESILPPSRRSPGAPAKLQHDATQLLDWFLGDDPAAWKVVAGAAAAPLAQGPPGNPLFAAALEAAARDAVTPAVVAEVNTPAIGGPLYPPVQALLFAPMGAIDRPRIAYHAFQVFSTVMVVVAGLGVTVLSRGRIPWSVATLAIFLFPGTRSGLDLGQNPTLTLAIVVWGWALASRGYDVAGGAVWGLLAYKPVWAVAFFLVPLLTRRWRFAAGMTASGAALVAATIPFVGVQTWLDWLQVGGVAARVYNVDENWIHLSRDLHGVPRRILHDFSLPREARDTGLANALAWSLWGVVLAATAVVYLRHADRRQATGVGAAFLFLGAFLTCYRFMYYDALLAAAGCAVLFAEPSRFLRTRVYLLSPTALRGAGTRALPAAEEARPSPQPRLLAYLSSFPLTILACLLLYENVLCGWDLQATIGFGYFTRTTTGTVGATGVTTPTMEFSTNVNYPWETALIVVLWLWCGWRLIRERRPDATGMGS